MDGKYIPFSKYDLASGVWHELTVPGKLVQQRGIQTAKEADFLKLGNTNKLGH